MAKKDEGSDEIGRQILRALTHPLRVRILRLLEEGPSGPKRLADRIEEPLANVAYHMNVLLDCGCIELVETIPCRGALEHIYNLKPGKALGSFDWLSVLPSLRRGMAGSSLDALTTRAVEALNDGSLQGREDSRATWLPLLVDEKGWKDLVGIADRVKDGFCGAAERSAERLEGSTGGIRVVVAVLAFEAASGKAGS